MVGLSERFQYFLELDAQGAIRSLQKFGDTAEKELKGAEARLDKIGGRMQVAGAGAVAFAGVAGRALYSLGQDAANLEQAVGGTEAVFGEWAGTIEAAAESAAQSAGLSDRAFREATTSIGGNLKRMGFDVGAAADQSIELTQVAADLAATYGGTTAEAVQALGAAFRGEADPAERFNLNLKISEVNAKAVAMGLADSEQNVSEYAKAQALLALIMEQSADAQGQFAREANTASGAMQIAAAEGENMRASLGDAVAPIIADVSEKLAGMAGWLADANEATDGGVGKFLAYGTAAVGAAGAISFVGGTVIKARDQITSATSAVSNFVSTAGGIGPAMTKALGPLGAAAAVIGGIVYEVQRSGERAQEAENRITGYAEAMRELGGEAEGAAAKLAAAVAQSPEIAAAMADAEISVDELSRALVDGGHSAEVLIDRLVESARATGMSGLEAEALRKSLQLTIGELDQAASHTENLSTVTDENTAATDENTQATNENTEAIKARDDAVRGSLGVQLSLQEAMLRTQEEIEAYNEVMADGTATDRDREQAGIDLLQQFIAQGEAAKDLAETQAEAAGRAATATQEGTDAQILHLLALAKELEPGSPLRVQLEEYIAALGRIPRDVTTNVNTRYRVTGTITPDVPVIPIAGGRMAHGGPVSKGKAYWVGDKFGVNSPSAELFVPDEDGAILNQAQLSNGSEVAAMPSPGPNGKSMAMGGGVNVTQFISFDFSGATAGAVQRAEVTLPGALQRAAAAAARAAK